MKRPQNWFAVACIAEADQTVLATVWRQVSAILNATSRRSEDYLLLTSMLAENLAELLPELRAEALAGVVELIEFAIGRTLEIRKAGESPPEDEI